MQAVVWDDAVLSLDDKGRSAIVEYLSVDPRQLFLGKSHMRNNHPAIARAYDILAKFASERKGDALPVYPNLDKAVTAQTRHLLKSVFSVHPSSGYLALPIVSLAQGFQSCRPLLTLADLETMANENRLTDPTSIWARHLAHFDAVTAPTTKKRPRP